MIVGDVATWTARFVSVDDRFVEQVAAHWPGCLSSLGSEPLEDSITINLVARLVRDPIVRRLCHVVVYQHEPFGTDANGAKYSKGRIDLAVLFDWERERYLAYECKRLCVRTAGGRASLATAYVTEGMMRFITEQYAQDLPIGCMLGYVLDGDTTFAQRQIEASIRLHGPIAMVRGPNRLPDIGRHVRFETEHARSGGAVRLRHTLLACPAPAHPTV